MYPPLFNTTAHTHHSHQLHHLPLTHTTHRHHSHQLHHLPLTHTTHTHHSQRPLTHTTHTHHSHTPLTHTTHTHHSQRPRFIHHSYPLTTTPHHQDVSMQCAAKVSRSCRMTHTTADFCPTTSLTSCNSASLTLSRPPNTTGACCLPCFLEFISLNKLMDGYFVVIFN